MLAGCTADEQSWIESGQVPVQLTVSQDVSGDVTRTTNDLHTATTGFAVDETMKIFMKTSSGTSSQVYKVASVSSGTATLTDNGTKLYYPTGTSGSVQLYAVYPSDITSAGTHTVAYDQTGDTNYRSSDLMYSAAKTVNLSSKTTQQTLNNFEHQMVRLKLNIIKASNVTSVTKVVMNNVKRKVTVSTLNESGITLNAAVQATGETSGTGNNLNEIQIFSGTNSSTSQQTYYVVFPKQVTSGNDWNGTDFITVTADDATATYTLTKAFTAGRQYELTLNINAAALNNTVAITSWTDTDPQVVNPTTIIETKLEAVDLGLPSGTKWANMNVGANSETDYGDYFMWGDVAGYGGAVSSGTTADGYNFNWANYKYCNGSSSTLTKYNNNSSNGTVDNKTTLESMDDAATTHLGSPWRMPTAAELVELYRTNPNYSAYNNNYSGSTETSKIEGYTWTWCDGSTTKYKNTTAVGYKITRTSTGATIFLPAAGVRDGTGVYRQGSLGNYWSSSLSAGRPDYAWYLYFGSGDANMIYDFRYRGFSVRAVQ